MRKKKTKDQAEIFREESRGNKMVVQLGAGGLVIHFLCSAPTCTMHCVLLLSCLSISNDQECYRTINREDMKILQDIYYMCKRSAISAQNEIQKKIYK